MSEIVQSLDRALTILELISEYNEGLSLIEITGKANLNKSTAHRLLKTLILKGFVIKDENNNNYKLSMKPYEIGARKVDNLDILTASKQYTRNLMDKFNETVHLVVREDSDVVYIDKVEADNNIRMASKVGQRSPMYCTSVGKSMMALMGEDEVEIIWKQSNIIKLTDNTIVDFNTYMSELIKIKELGFAVDNEENEMGVRCIGAAVFIRDGKIGGAISVSGPVERISNDKIEIIANEVRKVANLISKELGYREKN
ncbi:MAG: IclR family transcriptional regulator [Gudongella sp.]|nr:IclR family transcriptional regulator [Gudongella sp.]